MAHFLIIDNLSFILEAHEFSESSTKGSTLIGKTSPGSFLDVFGASPDPSLLMNHSQIF